MEARNALAASERPTRSYMENANIMWRRHKPNYDLVDFKYLTEKTKCWKEDSMEKLVENLVKTWEMESSHKVQEEDWGTIDHEKFKIILNGNKTFTLKDNIEIGNYNILLSECQYYQQKTNEESHEEFRSVFKSGFAWELTELFSETIFIMKSVKPANKELMIY